MADKPSHLEEVPAGGPSFQDMATATDQAVFAMMSELRGDHPGLGGAIVAGTAGGLARYQLQAMPEGTSAQQVLEVLAPIIRNVAGQMVAERRKRTGKPEPKVPVVAPQKMAFDRLQSVLASAPFPTYCIGQQDGRLLLISAMIARDGVLTHGSVANLAGATHRPEEVVHAHCRSAAIRWKAEADLLARIKAKAEDHKQALAAVPDTEEAAPVAIAHGAAIEALNWVDRIIDNPETEENVTDA